MIKKDYFLTLILLLVINIKCFCNNLMINLNTLKFHPYFYKTISIHLLNLYDNSSVVSFKDIFELVVENKPKNKFIKSLNKFYSETEFGESFIYNVSLSNKLFILNIRYIIPKNLQNVFIIKSSIKNKLNETITIQKINYLTGYISKEKLKNFGSVQLFGFFPYSSPDREDWILQIRKGISRLNFQGNDYDDYGGGLPILDIWGKNFGVAVASLSDKQELINLPLNYTDDDLTFGITDNIGFELEPKEQKNLVPIALIYHNGDFFNAIKIYSNLLEKSFINFNGNYSEDRFETEWCSWGYERNFSKEQILGTLDLVKSLNIKWITIDDGWQNVYGDFDVSNKKFLNEEDFKTFIDTLHKLGFKVRLWWSPLMASDSSYCSKDSLKSNEFGCSLQSELALKHPNWFMLKENGQRYNVSWWNGYLLCPALDSVREYFKSFIVKAIQDWRVDGFKLDGQHLNSFPPCYNKEHNHKTPYESTLSLSRFFNEVNKIAKQYKSNFLIQLCPCGTNYSIYNLPYIDQVVASDPKDSKQIRIKGKTFKALFGNNISYSGDHVELTNRKWDDFQNKFIVYNREDFLSTIAVGGILSTKFTNPDFIQPDSTLSLTFEKFTEWFKWFELFNSLKLYRGEYINLYDIAFDFPETHLIKKDGDFYYSFFADGTYEGIVELRGLRRKTIYKIYDLIENKELGKISGTRPIFSLKFNKYSFLKLIEVK